MCVVLRDTVPGPFSFPPHAHCACIGGASCGWRLSLPPALDFAGAVHICVCVCGHVVYTRRVAPAAGTPGPCQCICAASSRAAAASPPWKSNCHRPSPILEIASSIRMCVTPFPPPLRASGSCGIPLAYRPKGLGGGAGLLIGERQRSPSEPTALDTKGAKFRVGLIFDKFKFFLLQQTHCTLISY